MPWLMYTYVNKLRLEISLGLVLDFQTDRPQSVEIHGVASHTIILTLAPHRDVPWPTAVHIPHTWLLCKISFLFPVDFRFLISFCLTLTLSAGHTSFISATFLHWKVRIDCSVLAWKNKTKVWTHIKKYNNTKELFSLNTGQWQLQRKTSWHEPESTHLLQ